VEVFLNFIGRFNVPNNEKFGESAEPAEEETPDFKTPVERRREIGRNSYYRHRDEILAKKATERERAKATKWQSGGLREIVSRLSCQIYEI